LWLCIALLLLPWPSYASEPNKQLLSIEYKLSRIIGYSDRLKEELQQSQKISEEQKKQIKGLLTELSGLKAKLDSSQKISAEQKKNIERLLSELGQLRTELEASKTSLQKYRHRADELLNTIGQLETRLKQLSASYEASEISWEKALDAAETEIRIRKIRTMIMAIVAFLAGAGLGYGLKSIIDR
jgi:chromosome segregation ATPase